MLSTLTPHHAARLLLTAARNVSTLRVLGDKLRSASRVISIRSITESFIPLVSRVVRPALASESSLRTALIPVLRKALLAGAAAGNVKLRARGYKPTFDPSSINAWLTEHVALSAKSIAATTSQLTDPATDERIALIAQTEAHTAVCQGQRMAWRSLRALGDVEGHEFHGNQWTNISTTPYSSGRINASIQHKGSIGGHEYVKGSSHAEAQVEKDGTVTLMRLHTDQEYRGRGVAKALINRVRVEAGDHVVKTSGVFSPGGQAVLDSFVRKGEAEKTESGNYVFKKLRAGARTLARRGFIEPRRMWLTMTGACEQCEELDGKTARMEGQYPGEGGDGPPLHINCMCEEDLVDNDEE